jgi:hypothetical protein
MKACLSLNEKPEVWTASILNSTPFSQKAIKYKISKFHAKTVLKKYILDATFTQYY